MSKSSLLSLILGCALGAGIAVASLDWLRPAAPGTSSGGPIAGDDATARVREVLEQTDSLRRVSDLAVLLPTLDPSAAASIVDVFETSAIDSGDPELVLFGMWWAQHDPKAAFDWTRTDWRARHANVIAGVVRIWARTDPKTAFGAARGLPFQNHRDLGTDAAIAGWDESGLPGLMESLAQFNQIQIQQICEGIARRRVVALGPEGALRWVDGLEQNPYRDVLSVRVASAVAADKNGAPLAGEWARSRVQTAKGNLSNYPRRIGTRWVQHDPEAAMAWLASLPAGDDRDDGVAESFRTWLRHDAPAAHAWMEKAIQHVERWNEPAVAIYAKAIAWERPKEAIELTRQLTDEGWREPTTIVVGQVWSGSDPEAAKAWLAQADLPEHTRRTAAMARNTNPANQEELQKLRKASGQPDAGGAVQE